MKAPTTGPNTVPRPPSRVIRTTSPDMVQWTSVREASWNTMALVPPARPERVAERHRARLVLAHSLEHLPKGRVDRAVEEQEAGQEDGEDHEVHAEHIAKVEHTQEHAPRHRLDAVLPARE